MKKEHTPNIIVTDQMGREVPLPQSIGRIVSLVPSQTELLFDLGLQDKIVGLTKFCIHPRVGCAKKAKVGGTKKFNYPSIDQLKPDLIIGNKEENYEEGIQKLSERYPVWMSDIVNLEDALLMISSLGTLLERDEAAKILIDDIRSAFERLRPFPKQSVLYLIWRKPYMVAGEGTFIHNMLHTLGLENTASGLLRYPSLEEEEIQALAPGRILLSSEPYPFKEKHIEELRHLCPQSEVSLVDGEMFSWYGSRLRYAPAYFTTLRDAWY